MTAEWQAIWAEVELSACSDDSTGAGALRATAVLKSASALEWLLTSAGCPIEPTLHEALSQRARELGMHLPAQLAAAIRCRNRVAHEGYQPTQDEAISVSGTLRCAFDALYSRDPVALLPAEARARVKRALRGVSALQSESDDSMAPEAEFVATHPVGVHADVEVVDPGHPCGLVVTATGSVEGIVPLFEVAYLGESFGASQVGDRFTAVFLGRHRTGALLFSRRQALPEPRHRCEGIPASGEIDCAFICQRFPDVWYLLPSGLLGVESGADQGAVSLHRPGDLVRRAALSYDEQEGLVLLAPVAADPLVRPSGLDRWTTGKLAASSCARFDGHERGELDEQYLARLEASVAELHRAASVPFIGEAGFTRAHTAYENAWAPFRDDERFWFGLPPSERMEALGLALRGQLERHSLLAYKLDRAGIRGEFENRVRALIPVLEQYSRAYKGVDDERHRPGFPSMGYMRASEDACAERWALILSDRSGLWDGDTDVQERRVRLWKEFRLLERVGAPQGEGSGAKKTRWQEALEEYQSLENAHRDCVAELVRARVRITRLSEAVAELVELRRRLGVQPSAPQRHEESTGPATQTAGATPAGSSATPVRTSRAPSSVPRSSVLDSDDWTEPEPRVTTPRTNTDAFGRGVFLLLSLGLCALAWYCWENRLAHAEALESAAPWLWNQAWGYASDATNPSDWGLGNRGFLEYLGSVVLTFVLVLLVIFFGSILGGLAWLLLMAVAWLAEVGGLSMIEGLLAILCLFAAFYSGSHKK